MSKRLFRAAPPFPPQNRYPRPAAKPRGSFAPFLRGAGTRISAPYKAAPLSPQAGGTARKRDKKTRPPRSLRGGRAFIIFLHKTAAKTSCLPRRVPAALPAPCRAWRARPSGARKMRAGQRGTFFPRTKGLPRAAGAKNGAWNAGGGREAFCRVPRVFHMKRRSVRRRVLCKGQKSAKVPPPQAEGAYFVGGQPRNYKMSPAMNISTNMMRPTTAMSMPTTAKVPPRVCLRVRRPMAERTMAMDWKMTMGRK